LASILSFEKAVSCGDSLFKELHNPIGESMLHPVINPVVALIAGVLILVFPAILNYVVAFYLIIIGIMGIASNL